jgi:hypothetical protein
MSIAKEVNALRRMATRDLKSRYADLFGEPTRSGHREWLVKRIAWRMQVLAEGDLSERARRRVDQLANDADLRIVAPREAGKKVEAEPPVIVPFAADNRLPAPGTVLTRRYKGRLLTVKVLDKGFEHDGTFYESLSAAAKAISGSHCNGFAFFNLKQGGQS